jgi:hypothetical protein
LLVGWETVNYPAEMLTSAPTKFGAGITFYGDFYDLSAVHETIHKTAGQKWVEEGGGNFMLGLAYEFRKALEGKREKRTFGINPMEKVKYRGCSVLWPHVLTQIGMIRYFAAYRTTDHKDQACLYLLEDCAITSLLAFDGNVGKKCAEWLVRFKPFPNDYLFRFITDVCCRRFLFEVPEKQRFAELPTVLGMIDSFSEEYRSYAEQVEKAARKLKTDPKNGKSSEDWPSFAW